MTLPCLGTTLEKNCRSVYGLGFVETSDDYKVVGITFVRNRFVTEINVYSLRTNSWRRMEKFRPGLVFPDSGKLVNGALHWLWRTDSPSRTWDLVSFDLTKETFGGDVGQPNYGEGNFYVRLGVLGGCLCVLRHSPETLRGDTWIMKENGSTDSWTKIASLPYPSPFPFSKFNPFRSSKNNDLLLDIESVLINRCKFSNQLELYNLNDKKSIYPRICEFRGYILVDTFMENLVSFNAGDAAGQQQQ